MRLSNSGISSYRAQPVVAGTSPPRRKSPCGIMKVMRGASTMGAIATVDADNRIQIPLEIREWFKPGERFAVGREGDVVTLRPLSGLKAHLNSLDDQEPPSWEEIDAEVQAVRASERVR